MNNTKVNKVIISCDKTIELINKGIINLNNTRYWNIYDIFGGSYFPKIVKENFANDSKYIFKKINLNIKDLDKELKSLNSNSVKINSLENFLETSNNKNFGEFINVKSVIRNINELKKLKTTVEDVKDEIYKKEKELN